MITKIDDLQVYLEFKNICSYNDRHYDKLPVSVQEIIKNLDNRKPMVTPQDCTPVVLKEFLIFCLRSLEPKYEVDVVSEPAIDKLIGYLMGTELNSKKGILLMGGTGSGKTVLLKGFNKLLRYFSTVDRCEIHYNYISSLKLASQFSIKGYEIFENSFYSGNGLVLPNITMCSLFVDDMGAEPIVSNYGNSIIVTGELLMRRYENKKRTIATTNLNAESLREYYGERIYSRMKEMFNPMVLDGDDRRHY